MVATISRIRGAIATLFSHSNEIPFQKQHHTSKSQLQVNKTHVNSCKIAKSSAHTPNASNNSLTTLAKKLQSKIHFQLQLSRKSLAQNLYCTRSANPVTKFTAKYSHQS